MRRRTPQDQLDAERAQLDALIEAEYEQRTAELKRALTSARAELTSMLQEESRRLGEEWRVEFAERERRAAAEYSMRLVQVQKRVEDRLTAWAHDLERTTGEIESQVGRLEALQKERLAQVERTLAHEADALRAESDEQRVAVLRLREEVQNAAAEAIREATNDLEQMAAERRRALHEVGERLRRRERELREQIEREEVDATQRLAGSFADVERRQAERLARSLEREATRIVEAAAQEFDKAVRAARDEAVRRLSRELDDAISEHARRGAVTMAARELESGAAPVD
ncbi:MAG: hypothetical protein ABWY51_03955 [Gaiellaceae bacterium]